MSPQNWLCWSERCPALDTLALNSPLGHFNGDNTRLSTRRTKTMVTLKQSLTRPTTHAAISTFSTSYNSISSQYSQPFTSLAAPKANQIFHTVAFLARWFTLEGVCCCCEEIWLKRTRVFEDDVFIENTHLVGGSERRTRIYART